MVRICSLLGLIIIVWSGCEQPEHSAFVNYCARDPAEAGGRDGSILGALVSTKFNSFDEFKESVTIEYFNKDSIGFSTTRCKTWVRISHCSNGLEVVSELRPGVSEDDFVSARDGGIRDKLYLLFKAPYAVAHRADMQRIFTLARRRPDIYGDGDPAFYDLSEEIMGNIRKRDSLKIDYRDLTSEKGYFNTINHITAQAFMTSIFSERLADFMADAHERKTIPELITGDFTPEQIADIENGPVDNFVDIINNEWGQELGKLLREEYGIHRSLFWTPDLLADYLNDIQRYYRWVFQIDFSAFSPDDEVIVRFADKINTVLNVGEL